MKDGTLPIPPSMTTEDEIEKSFSNLSGVVTSATLPSLLIEANPNPEMLAVVQRWVEVEPADLETVNVLLNGQVDRVASTISQQQLPSSQVVVHEGKAAVVEKNGDRGVLIDIEKLLLREEGKLLASLVCDGDEEAQVLAEKFGITEVRSFSGQGPSGDLYGTIVICGPIRKVVVKAFQDGNLLFVEVVDRPPTVRLVDTCVDLAVSRALTTREKLA